ncbi:MAG: hypothetical protein AB2814_05070, partial [Candidatus Sedimenticola endophacoides]
VGAVTAVALASRFWGLGCPKIFHEVATLLADGLWLAKNLGQGKKVGSSSRINLWQQLKQRMAEELER